VLGEHGTSQVFVWSSARVAGVPIHAALGQSKEEAKAFRKQIEEDVRYANITIIEGTGASQLGIGLAVARMTEMILRDEQAAIPIGVYNSGYGVTLSLPTVVGRSGAARVLEVDLVEAERKALDTSADTLRRAVAQLDRRG
jgi:L-lactate dehydrogenase